MSKKEYETESERMVRQHKEKDKKHKRMMQQYKDWVAKKSFEFGLGKEGREELQEEIFNAEQEAKKEALKKLKEGKNSKKK